MIGHILTQNNTFIIGPVAKLEGYIMEGIFYVLDKISIPNIGLAIIIFTAVIYLLMLPLTIKQQKFSKLQAKMNPEIQAISAKYKGKKDQDSQMAMNQETQAVYAKYGVSPTGSCLQLVIQMPILFALYRVIYSIPAYVGKVKEAFLPIVNELMTKQGASELLQSFKDATMFAGQFKNEAFVNNDVTYVTNTFVDVLNRASTAEWKSIYDAANFPELKETVTNTLLTLDRYNNFLGINIGNSPSYTVKEAFANGSYLIVVGALLIPILSAVTQWINTKLMPQASTSNNDDPKASSMASSMKAMNTFMPIFSAVMCFTLPAGMGIYWIAGSVVRSIQQVVINRYIDNMDMDEMIKKNVEKRNAKLKKAGIDPNKLTSNASISTKAVTAKPEREIKDNTEQVKKSTEYYQNNAKPGSIASKANMVKQYNEKNNK